MVEGLRAVAVSLVIMGEMRFLFVEIFFMMEVGGIGIEVVVVGVELLVFEVVRAGMLGVVEVVVLDDMVFMRLGVFIDREAFFRFGRMGK